MQAVVGGLIQAVYPFEEAVALVCNDDGKLLGLPLNRALREPETGRIYDVVAGVFFLCAAPPDSDHFDHRRSLPFALRDGRSASRFYHRTLVPVRGPS